MIETIRQGLKADGFDVSISKLCRWFNVPRRTVYYRPTKAAPGLQERFVAPIKAMIEEKPVVRVPHGRAPAGVQQEHRAARLPVEGLAGP